MREREIGFCVRMEWFFLKASGFLAEAFLLRVELYIKERVDR